MKNKIFNATHISGKLYQHSLELKTTKPDAKNPNTPYIAGNVEIATDNAMTNIVSVHFTYVTATTSKGNPNATFKVLGGIIDGAYKSVIEHGKDAATMFTIDSAIGLNEFYSTRNGEEELVSVKRNEGGFIRVTNELEEDENKRNTFDTDIILNKVSEICCLKLAGSMPLLRSITINVLFSVSTNTILSNSSVVFMNALYLSPNDLLSLISV